jgi:tRNA A37 N6-isopentenylltransferase MiaA
VDFLTWDQTYDAASFRREARQVVH